MIPVFDIAAQIATLLSLSALAILVFFYLAKIAFEQLDLAKVIGLHTFRIIMCTITYIFVLALIGLFLGTLSFIETKYFNAQHEAAFDTFIINLDNSDVSTRAVAADKLTNIAESSVNNAARICRSLAALIRCGAAASLSEAHPSLADDIQRSIVEFSRLNELQKCDEIVLSGNDLRRLQLPGGNLLGAILVGAHLDQSNLAGTNSSRAKTNGCVLTEAVLRNANLTKASLHEVFWRNVDLRDANLSFATDLAGADITTVRVENTIFEGVNPDNTKLSSNFE